MKRGILILIAIISNSLSAQILHPVRWAYAIKKIDNNEAIVSIKATIQTPWHIYSIHQKDGGPIKTSFIFTQSADYEVLGTVKEPTPISKYEKSFNMNVNYFEQEVIFYQKVRLKSAHPVIKGTLNFMVCNDQKCLPPEDIEFTIPIK